MRFKPHAQRVSDSLVLHYYIRRCKRDITNSIIFPIWPYGTVDISLSLIMPAYLKHSNLEVYNCSSWKLLAVINITCQNVVTVRARAQHRISYATRRHSIAVFTRRSKLRRPIIIQDATIFFLLDLLTKLVPLLRFSYRELCLVYLQD